MTTYVIQRLLLMVPTLFGITFLTYVIIRSAPGDPTAMQGDLEKGPQKETLTAGDQGDYKKLLHLDKPAATAYFYWVRDFFTPEANVSSTHKVFVFDVILNRLPNTLNLNFFALIIIYAVGLTLGIDSAVHARSVRERVITFLLFLLYSLPSFWVGLNLIVWFGRGGRLLTWLPEGLVWLRILIPAVAVLFLALRLQRAEIPAGLAVPRSRTFRQWVSLALEVGAWIGLAAVLFGLLALLALKFGNPLSWGELGALVFGNEIPEGLLRGLPLSGLEPENASRLSYLTMLQACVPYFIMPVFCITYGGLAGESRYMRVGLMEILRQDYIRTAKAKGLAGSQVVLRHALPNALTPIIVQVAGILPGMIGGSVIIETIFNVPGMGYLFYEAVLSRDYNMVMAGAFMGALLTLVGILISDLLLPTLDPRVTFEGRKA